MMHAATERLREAGEWKTAPLSVGAGVTRSLRWLRRLPALWLRGWLGYARAAGAEPAHLLGPNPWLARRTGEAPVDAEVGATRFSAAIPGTSGSSELSWEEPWVEEDDRQVIRGVLGDENWVRLIRPAADAAKRSR